MQLNEFQQLVDSVLLPTAAMSGDPIGTQVGSRRGTATKILVCFEVTDAVITEAQQLSCDVIVTFHPLIYSPLRSITRNDRVGRLVCALIEHDIALISVHTAYDAHPMGTNTQLAHMLGLQAARPLVPVASMPSFGMGGIATSATDLTMADLLDRVTRICGGTPRFLAPPASTVRTVALVAGSGGSFLDDAISAGADVFITADLKYHAYHAADGTIGLIDPGHFEMEQFVASGIIGLLEPIVGSAAELVASRALRNPVQYYIEKHVSSNS